MKKGRRIFIVAVVHFLVFLFVFFMSLDFTFPGEPGYDAGLAAQSDFCGHYILPVLGFPLLWVVDLFHPIPWFLDGVCGWLWFFANSLLWALGICQAWDYFKRGKEKLKMSQGIRISAIGILALSLVLGGRPLSAEEGPLLLDSFEGKIEKGTVDFGAKEGSTAEVLAATDEKACGNQALKLTYDLEEGAYMYCARGHGLDVAGALWEGPAPDAIAWKDYKAISFQVKDTRLDALEPGHLPGPIAFDLKDAGGEIWRFAVTVMRPGWQQITVPFDHFKVRDDWQPQTADGNRTLDFPVKSFQWEPRTAGAGVIYFDCVQLEK